MSAPSLARDTVEARYRPPGFLARLLRRPSGLVGLVAGSGLAAPLLCPGDPLDMVAAPLQGPGADPAYPPGTDMLGRDLAAGIADGARSSLLIGAVATRALFAAVPSLERRQRRASGNLARPDVRPRPCAPPSGCPYDPRCPIAMARGRWEPPRLRDAAGTGHRVACHLA